MAKSGEGKGWHGDSEGHADAARERSGGNSGSKGKGGRG